MSAPEFDETSARTPDGDSHSENAAVTQAITSRRAIRAFLPTRVSRSVVERILEVASRAPSGSNIQPWHVAVLTGASLEKLKQAIGERFDAGDRGGDEYQYYPDPWREPYLSRRRKLGWSLYGVLGIERHHKKEMTAQLRRNFMFFDAPVGMIFSIDRDLPVGSWLDCGMFIENVMIAARAFELHTCPEQAFAAYHDTIREQLGIPEGRTIICGLALGVPDFGNPANALKTERLPLTEFVRFHS